MVSVQKSAKRRLLAVNEKGYRLGEDHHRAKLTNHEVDLVLELLASGMSERLVAEKMEISRRTVRDYKAAKTRAQAPAEYLLVEPVEPRITRRDCRVHGTAYVPRAPCNEFAILDQDDGADIVPSKR